MIKRGLLVLCIASLLAAHFASLPALAAPASPRMAVLTYHHVHPRERSPFTVTPARLASDLSWLLAEGWCPVSYEDFRRWKAGELTITGDSFLVTFDDGYEGMALYGLPVLQELQVPAVLFLTTARIDRGRGITSASLRRVLESGLVSLQSHTHNLHRFVAGVPAVLACTAEQLVVDLNRSDTIIASWTGARPGALAWPFGAADETALAVAGAAYELQFGIAPGFVDQDDAIIPRFAADWRSSTELRWLLSRSGNLAGPSPTVRFFPARAGQLNDQLS